MNPKNYTLAQRILAEHYGLASPMIQKMEGYASENYRVSTESEKFVLKIYAANENIGFLHATNDITAELGSAYPNNIASIKQDKIVQIEQEGEIFYAQLLTYLDGEFLAEIKHTPQLLSSFGTFLGKMNAQLVGLKSDPIVAGFNQWDLQHCLSNEAYVQFISDPGQRRLVQYYFQQYKECVVPIQYQLRKSIIHSDANDWNVLCDEGQVSAMIDFGDICYSYLINELAIAITYALFAKADPIEMAVHIIKAYHQELALQEDELSVLYYLIAARLCVSVCNSAFAKTQQENVEYITISEKPAWELLEKWITINPIFAEEEFRKACGFKSLARAVTERLHSKRTEHLGDNLSVSYQEPIHFEKAALQYMYASNGKTYLDAYNNIKHLGHCHPKVVDAIQRQAARLNTNTRYLYHSLTTYADKLLQQFPERLNKVFFVNSGSAASDSALRLARTHTGAKDMLVMHDGYHGNTIASIEVSHYKFSHAGGLGAAEHIHPLSFPEYSEQFRETCEQKWKLEIEMALLSAKAKGLAGFISEPILGCAGQRPLPPGYLKMMYAMVREAGGVCIADEVQIGFGRTGKYWGWEHHDVVPDIVILGKPIGNGHPLAAVVTTSEIANSFDNGMEFFSSFGGNPVSCAVGSAVLDVIEEENLIEHAIAVGEYFISQLKALQTKYPIIYDVRGQGLFIGIEFRRPHEAESITPYIKEELKKRCILSSTDGPGERTLKIKPPMIFNKDNVDEFTSALEDILRMLAVV